MPDNQPVCANSDPSITGAVCYTVVVGDTLISIAQNVYGGQIRSDGNQVWVMLYNDNSNTIDSTAAAHGFPGGGHWIFAGTTLQCRRVVVNGVVRP